MTLPRNSKSSSSWFPPSDAIFGKKGSTVRVNTEEEEEEEEEMTDVEGRHSAGGVPLDELDLRADLAKQVLLLGRETTSYREQQ